MPEPELTKTDLTNHYFEEWGNAYLVIDFVEGQSLADRIAARGPLPEAQVLDWARQLLDALAYCHAQGVVHRDIKPQNIIIRPDGRPVLVDFGLVKLWDPRDPRTRTVVRAMGTPEYAPPEQWGAGHTSPDKRLGRRVASFLVAGWETHRVRARRRSCPFVKFVANSEVYPPTA